MVPQILNYYHVRFFFLLQHIFSWDVNIVVHLGKQPVRRNLFRDLRVDCLHKRYDDRQAPW